MSFGSWQCLVINPLLYKLLLPCEYFAYSHTPSCFCLFVCLTSSKAYLAMEHIKSGPRKPLVETQACCSMRNRFYCWIKNNHCFWLKWSFQRPSVPKQIQAGWIPTYSLNTVVVRPVGSNPIS